MKKNSDVSKQYNTIEHAHTHTLTHITTSLALTTTVQQFQ